MITSTIGLLLALARICYKSKCKNIKFCGLEIERDVVIEEKEDELRIAAGQIEGKDNDL